MKRKVEIVETDEGGMLSMLGEKITLYGGVYIYTGVLVGVNEDHVELDDAYLVYDAGALDTGPWEDAQKLLDPHRVQTMAVESWGPAKC